MEYLKDIFNIEKEENTEKNEIIQFDYYITEKLGKRNIHYLLECWDRWSEYSNFEKKINIFNYFLTYIECCLLSNEKIIHEITNILINTDAIEKQECLISLIAFYIKNTTNDNIIDFMNDLFKSNENDFKSIYKIMLLISQSNSVLQHLCKTDIWMFDNGKDLQDKSIIGMFINNVDCKNNIEHAANIILSLLTNDSIKYHVLEWIKTLYLTNKVRISYISHLSYFEIVELSTDLFIYKISKILIHIINNKNINIKDLNNNINFDSELFFATHELIYISNSYLIKKYESNIQFINIYNKKIERLKTMSSFLNVTNIIIQKYIDDIILYTEENTTILSILDDPSYQANLHNFFNISVKHLKYKLEITNMKALYSKTYKIVYNIIDFYLHNKLYYKNKSMNIITDCLLIIFNKDNLINIHEKCDFLEYFIVYINYYIMYNKVNNTIIYFLENVIQLYINNVDELTEYKFTIFSIIRSIITIPESHNKIKYFIDSNYDIYYLFIQDITSNIDSYTTKFIEDINKSDLQIYAYIIDEIIEILYGVIDINSNLFCSKEFLIGFIVTLNCCFNKLFKYYKSIINKTEYIDIKLQETIIRIHKDIFNIYLALYDKSEIVNLISNDIRSWDYNLFMECLDIINEKKLISPNKINIIRNILEEINTIELSNKEQNNKKVPEELCDPIMGTLIEDPVILPSSGIFIDKTTILRHLLVNKTDPFNRDLLTSEILDTYNNTTKIKAKICDFKNKIDIWRTK